VLGGGRGSFVRPLSYILIYENFKTFAVRCEEQGNRNTSNRLKFS
jgi:hypothetical protein